MVSEEKMTELFRKIRSGKMTQDELAQFSDGIITLVHGDVKRPQIGVVKPKIWDTLQTEAYYALKYNKICLMENYFEKLCNGKSDVAKLILLVGHEFRHFRQNEDLKVIREQGENAKTTVEKDAICDLAKTSFSENEIERLLGVIEKTDSDFASKLKILPKEVKEKLLKDVDYSQYIQMRSEENARMNGLLFKHRALKKLKNLPDLTQEEKDYITKLQDSEKWEIDFERNNLKEYKHWKSVENEIKKLSLEKLQQLEKENVEDAKFLNKASTYIFWDKDTKHLKELLGINLELGYFNIADGIWAILDTRIGKEERDKLFDEIAEKVSDCQFDYDKLSNWKGLMRINDSGLGLKLTEKFLEKDKFDYAKHILPNLVDLGLVFEGDAEDDKFAIEFAPKLAQYYARNCEKVLSGDKNVCFEDLKSAGHMIWSLLQSNKLNTSQEGFPPDVEKLLAEALKNGKEAQQKLPQMEENEAYKRQLYGDNYVEKYDMINGKKIAMENEENCEQQ